MSLTKCTDDLMMINNHLIECVEGSGPVTPFYTDPLDGAVYWTYFDGTGYGSGFEDVPLIGTDVLTGTGYKGNLSSPFNTDLTTYVSYGYDRMENTLSFTDLSYFGTERTVSSIIQMSAEPTRRTMTSSINLFDVKINIGIEFLSTPPSASYKYVTISVEPNYSTIDLDNCRAVNNWSINRNVPMITRTYSNSYFKAANWFRLTYTYSDGVLRIFINNDLVGYFTCTLTGNKNLTTSVTSTIASGDTVGVYMSELFINTKDLSKGHVRDLRLKYNPDGTNGPYGGSLPSSLLWHD